MGAYETRVINNEQYKNIVDNIRAGYIDDKGVNHKPNNAIATCLVLQANLGLRIGDLLKLKMENIVKDDGHYRLNIVEEKTGKSRFFIVPNALYEYINAYCDANNIGSKISIFSFTERAVQKALKQVTEYLGYENISTHSLRKYAGTKIYEASGFDIEMVRSFYQHASVTTTQRYIKRSTAQLEKAIIDTLTL